MTEPRRELGFTTESLHDFWILRERRIEHLERDLALQVQIAHAVDPAEAAHPQELQQLVVVAERPPETLFPSRAIFSLGQRALAHRDATGLEGARVRRQIFQHLAGRQVPILGGGLERAQDDALEHLRTGWSQLGWTASRSAVERRLLPGHCVEEQA